jgi:hypothetical protein
MEGAPRAVLLYLYAEAKGLDPRALLQAHMRYLKTFHYWILERLDLFGYSDVDARPELLELRPDDIADAVDAVLGVFRSKPEDAAALPPLLTLPEKLVVLETAGPVLIEALRGRKGLGSWLYVLHLASPRGPTPLGRALLRRSGEPAEAYVEAAERLGLLKWIIALEAAALDVGTKNELDALLAAYSKHAELNTHAIYSAFRYMASDVKGITMTAPALPPEKILELLGQL